jgi:O-antigen/teichoic acid export membrane protein
MVIIELACQLCTLGQKRGLAQRLSEDEREPEALRRPANVVADAMVLSSLLALVMMVLLFSFPRVMFPRGQFSEWDLLLPLAILPTTLTDIALSALAYRYDVATTVRSRSVVEPWTLSIAAGMLYFVIPEAGLPLSYLASILTSGAVALVVLLRVYGLPRQWVPHPLRIWRLALANLPLAAADAVEWGTRKLDIFILRFFVSDEVVGIYFVAQQVASLPQKLKTSFEPILGPVITRNLREKNYPAIARQVRQVGFWIIAAQAGVALALGLPGEGVMGLVGPTFVGGTGALAFLLAAEVVAATAVVSEAALIYMARFRNLIVSLATIVLQAGLTLAGIELVKGQGYSPLYVATIPAAALMVTLATASLVKSNMLGKILGESVNNWRWPLAWAAIPAIAVGGAATGFLPEWAELIFGIPAILGTYVWIIWHKGFGPEDRLLFRKNVGG